MSMNPIGMNNSPTSAIVQTVLVVDDDDSIQSMVKHLLEREGFRVALCSNGREALDYLRKSPDLPALILLDLRMPVMSGWEFRAVQKQDPRLSTVPVVVITSVSTAESDIASISAAAYVKKPIQVGVLMNTVKFHLLPTKVAA